ncbi:hypothetical protein B0H19DRAFT_1081674 [Mycena capillaripes]|nr:hypothetical protein B0H19DRAFT_1081674 [Mycena capillaripes]
MFPSFRMLDSPSPALTSTPGTLARTETNQPPPTHAGEFHGTTVHKDWYTDPNVPHPWSTDWEKWAGLDLFHQSVDGTLKIDKLFKEAYDVPGAVEPLAYMLQTRYEIFVFTAAGRYYIFDDGCLYHFLEKALPKGSVVLAKIQQRLGSDLGNWEPSSSGVMKGKCNKVHNSYRPIGLQPEVGVDSMDNVKTWVRRGAGLARLAILNHFASRNVGKTWE